MTVTVRPMRWWDITDVVALEQELFTDDTWSERTFWSELAQPDNRHYVVATEPGGRATEDGADSADSATDDATEGAPADTTDRAESAAVADGPVIGYAGLAVYADEGHVLTLGVRTDRQGGGLGGVLLRELLAAADRRGARRVLLEVRDGNLPAERLYLRHGFTRIGVRRRYYQPSGADAVVMVRGG